MLVLIPVYARLSIALWRQGQRPLGLLYGLASLAMVFVAGEEISWGQRIFGWPVPGLLVDINNQGETNVHNIGTLLRIFNLVVMGIALVAAVLPILRWTIWRERARSMAGYALVPPAVLIPAFGLEFSYRAIRLLILPTPRYTITKLSEFAELSFYFGLVVFGLLAWRAIVDGRRPSSQDMATHRRPTGTPPAISLGPTTSGS